MVANVIPARILKSQAFTTLRTQFLRCVARSVSTSGTGEVHYEREMRARKFGNLEFGIWNAEIETRIAYLPYPSHLPDLPDLPHPPYLACIRSRRRVANRASSEQTSTIITSTSAPAHACLCQSS